MISENQKKFGELLNMTKKLRGRYLNTLAAFKIYDRSKKLIAPNIVGKMKAGENMKIFKNYQYFFLPTQEAARCYFFIEIAKFFDKNKRGQSLSLEKTIEYANENLQSFSTAEFIKFHKDRQMNQEIFKNYINLRSSDITRIKKRLLNNRNIIKKIRDYRDQYLAHDDIKKIEVKITVREILVLLKLIQDVIDLFYYKLDFSTNIYSNFTKEPVSAIDRVVEGLKEYEKERTKKFKEKHGIK